MQVNILFFAAVRDQVGKPQLTLDIPEGSTIDDIQRRLKRDYPKAAGLFSVCRFTLGEEYANSGQVLPAGAEIGVIPPVSGGSGEVIHAKIVRGPIDPSILVSKVVHPSCGAALTFAGMVRTDDQSGRSVRCILYEGYEGMAEKVLRQIASDAVRVHEARVAVEHRLGNLEIGEISVGIAVATPHRSGGFEALREIIEKIKRDLPIWKREEFSDGTSEWVNCKVSS